jgi:hypothetical protein
MCSSTFIWRAAGLCLAFLSACGGSDGTVGLPTVEAVKPACGDNASATSVTVSGVLPVKPIISISDPSSSRLETTYRAWVGDVELTSVKWTSASELTALVPAGIPVGTYGLTLESPFGGKGVKDAAFQVRQGACPIETAALVTTNPVAAPATLTVGQDVTVTATVQNNGQAAALGVLASVFSAPAGFTVHGALPAAQDVPPGQARTFTWTYTASVSGGGVFVIDATGSAADSGLSVAAPRVNTNAVLVNPGAFLTANAVVAPTQATVGQLITVVLTVTNHSTTAAIATPAIAVTGPVTAGNAPTARSIPGGTTQAFQWTFTASAPGTATFTASVSGTDPGSGKQVTVPTAPADVTVQSPPGLAATLAIPSTIELGDFTVIMLVTNSGSATAADVAEVVPDQPTARAGSTAGVVLKSGPTGAPATVAAGQPAVAFTWVFTATSPGTLTLTSAARGREANTGTPVASGPAETSPARVGLHTVGGTVSGLVGAGLVLHNGVDSFAVPAGATSYVLPTPVGSGGAYAVTVTAQPTAPSQTCTVANGSGTMGAANVTNVDVTCTTSLFTVGGTVTGLAGSGLVLHNGTESLPVPADGPYTFTTQVPSGGTYAVTVTAQPAGPSQTCTVANASGTMGAASVTNVDVTCATSTFTVGGTVSGLAGLGLVVRNGAESLAIPAGATSYAFPTRVPSGGAYAVTVTAQPLGPSQTCTVANGSGTVGAANVTNVNVTCTTNTFTVGGTVTGLAGSGLVLRDGTESLPISANGPYAFTTRVASGGTYAVTVTAQPTGPSQTCTVANAVGAVGAANVTNVNVTCATSAFTLGGAVSGLAGAGLVLHNGTESLPISANGPYTFTTQVPSGGSYAVTVTAQPTVPSQICAVANGTGTVGATNVTNLNVTCTTSTFTVGGTVAGLAGAGLLLRNGAESLPIAADGAYAFPTQVPSGGTYAVTVTAQPTGPSQTCTVANATGTVGAANVTNVNVTCATSAFTVGGTITGLAGTGLVLRNGADRLTVNPGATSFVLPTPVLSGGTYAVAVNTQPRSPRQTCIVTNGTGTVGAANVINVRVTCTTNVFSVGGTVTGLLGNGLLLQNGADSLPLSAGSTTFVLPTPVPSGGSYAVAVTVQPTGPSQSCTVANGSGTVDAADVTDVAVSCVTNAFTVGGTITGLAGFGLVLRNGTESLSTASNGPFAFATPVLSGENYAVAVTAQPFLPAQTCTVANGSGTVGSTNVTSVAVTCAP